MLSLHGQLARANAHQICCWSGLFQLLMESSVYGERVMRNLNRRFKDPEDHKKYKKERHDRDTAQAWGASLGKPQAKPVRMKRPDQTTSPWEKDISDEEQDP